MDKLNLQRQPSLKLPTASVHHTASLLAPHPDLYHRWIRIVQCRDQPKDAACQKKKGTSGLESQRLTSWKNKLTIVSPPAQAVSSISHYTHKGTFINTTFNLLLVKTQKEENIKRLYPDPSLLTQQEVSQ